MIEDEKAFTEAVTAAVPLAEAGKLITFGIKANEPNTGFGYKKRIRRRLFGGFIC